MLDQGDLECLPTRGDLALAHLRVDSGAHRPTNADGGELAVFMLMRLLSSPSFSYSLRR